MGDNRLILIDGRQIKEWFLVFVLCSDRDTFSYDDKSPFPDPGIRSIVPSTSSKGVPSIWVNGSSGRRAKK